MHANLQKYKSNVLQESIKSQYPSAIRNMMFYVTSCSTDAAVNWKIYMLILIHDKEVIDPINNSVLWTLYKNKKLSSQCFIIQSFLFKCCKAFVKNKPLLGSAISSLWFLNESTAHKLYTYIYTHRHRVTYNHRLLDFFVVCVVYFLIQKRIKTYFLIHQN